ncbi:MAG: PAS domain S-box protein [Gomphosphaeria aponina SAG 52.96 = DSM 107014]|uniref:PAS domain S-box protein n=1 Tax=Gomphosphaeria aponina SAG 52.96 = DSM 107014 TaxID=1521640 RepID=A0A941GSD0_9CHRO|nr:PAS domain S-box protein [Gomphosphaeria aponina SAG 52.96 = DSM 107014]
MLIVHGRLSTINHQLSTINHQPSTINHQPSTINYQLFLRGGKELEQNIGTRAEKKYFELEKKYAELEKKFQEQMTRQAELDEQFKAESLLRQQTEIELKKAVALLKIAERQQAVIGELGRLALADTNLDLLMEETTFAIASTLKVKFAQILELLPNAAAFRLRSAVGFSSSWIGKKIVSASSQSMAGYTLITSETVVVQDLRLETRFGGSPFLHNHNVVSGVSVVIQGKNSPFGVLGVYSSEQREFKAEEISFLEAISNIIASAIERKIAEDELNSFFNLSVDMFCIAGIDGYFQRINPRFAENTGYSSSEILAKPFLDFVHPDDVKATQKEMENLSLGMPTVNFSNRYICADETYRWFSWTATPFEDGKLYAVARDITDQVTAAEKLEQQSLRERLVSKIALHIRGSLKLEEILIAAVKEVRQLLACDRVVVYKFAEENGTIIAESVGANFAVTLGLQIQDICSIWNCNSQLSRAMAVNNVNEAKLNVEHLKILEKLQVKANLCVPILIGESPQIWGFLMAHQCSAPREWQAEELKLLEELAVQISIAIGQSQLYQQVQAELVERRRVELALRCLNEELENTVADRTKKLRNANEQLQKRIVEQNAVEYALKQQNLKSRLFAEITLKIRQSLQLEEILQTTVTEVQRILQAERVLMYKIYPDGIGCVFMEAVQPPWQPMFNLVFEEEVFPKKYQQLYHSGMIKAVRDVKKSYPHATPCMLEFCEQWGIKAKLVVPILANDQLWGFLIAHQCSTSREWTEFEIELMRQLADQVGVALTQAQLLEALQKSEAQFRAIFQQAAVGIAQATLEGKFLNLNQRFCEIVGYDKKELLKRNFVSITYPNDVEADLNYLKQVLAGEVETFSMEKRYIRKDGSIVWVNLTVSLVIKVTGEPDYFIGVIQDISKQQAALKERKRTEEALRYSEERFRIALKNSPIVVFNQDKKLRYTWIYNPGFGFKAEDVIGKLDSEIFLPENAQKLTNLKEKVLKSGVSTREEVVVNYNNNIKCYDLTVDPLLSLDGKIIGVTCAALDISDRKNYELQLKNSLKEKEMLLKEIHHRVKNNLLVVSNLLEFQADYTEDPAIIQLLQDSQNRIYSMALIHEKLYRSTNLAKINFGEYLQDLVDNLFDSYKVWKQQILFELDLDSIFLNIETAHPCSLVVNELLSNALKHAFPERRSGKIWLALHQGKNQEITLTVRDNGIGFPENLDFRNTESLGMELVCTLTEQLEGQIELKREQGTCFQLTFSELQYRQRF